MSDVFDDAETTIQTTRPSLVEIEEFGSNPGHLRMHLFAPSVGQRAPLVVVLHGCRQDARGYDEASGWTRLAANSGFMVLYPEQTRTNNQDGCFQWFEAGHTRRGQGEVGSIRQMVATAIDRFGADPARIFITGLSAGGAMAGAMLASYPDVFAGGAIIAGLPYATAPNLSSARESMAGRTKKAKAWGDLVRAASDHAGPWPSVAVWHGMADPVVNPLNAGELVKQWTNVHGVGSAVPAEDTIGRVVRRTWRDDTGRICVADYSVPGLGHGAPVDSVEPPAPFFLPAGISSTLHIARDWGLSSALSRGHDETPEPADPDQKRSGFWSIFGF